MNRLFVPFGDLTNGVDLPAATSTSNARRRHLRPDFNRAYHPFCLFNSPTTVLS